MLTKKHTNRFITAEWIFTKFCTSTPWVDVMIYLNRYPNSLKGLGGWVCEIWPLPLTLSLASNTAYYAYALMILCSCE